MCNPITVRNAQKWGDLAPEAGPGGLLQGVVTHISSAQAKDKTIISGKIDRTCCFAHSWYGFGITKGANAIS